MGCSAGVIAIGLAKKLLAVGAHMLHGPLRSSSMGTLLPLLSCSLHAPGAPKVWVGALQGSGFCLLQR